MNPKPNESNVQPCRAARHLLQSLWLPLFLVAVCAGCKEGAKVAADTQASAGAADVNPVGNYALVTVDGNQVPCTVQHEGHTVAIKSGTFVINADGTCSSKLAFSLPSGGDAGREVKATYTRQGRTLTMRWEGAGTTTGTVQADTFTMNNEGMIFTYRRRGPA